MRHKKPAAPAPAVPARLWDTDEAASYLKLNRSTLEQWRVQGCGPRFVKLGDGSHSVVRYRVADLDAYIVGRLRWSTSDDGSSTVELVG